MSVPYNKENVATRFLDQFERQLDTLVTRAQISQEEKEGVLNTAVISLNFFVQTERSDNVQAYEEGMDRALRALADQGKIDENFHGKLMTTFSNGLAAVVEAPGDGSPREEITLAWGGGISEGLHL